MTELERIEIEGFKGLESVAFEPSQINLITGRNNTGKTSLLESVDLLLTPSNLSRFGSSADEVINIEQKKVNISGKYSKGEASLKIRKPGDNEVRQLIVQAVFNTIGFQSTLVYFGTEDNEDDLKEVIDDAVQDVLREELDQETIEALHDEFLIVSWSGSKYSYFLPGQESSRIISSVENRIREETSKRFEEMDLTGDEKDLDTDSNIHHHFAESTKYNDDRWDFQPSVKKFFGPSVQPTFLETPDSQGTSKFIRSIELTEDISEDDNENIGIKIDDIGDYLKENRIVDHLKTFDTDYLVFEKEDGEKYQIPYAFMGDGFKAIVGLLWELLDVETENEIVLLEEPENHMHPGYIRQVVYFLIHLAREEDVQLFITTHNSDFINDFFNENLTEDQREYLEDEFSLIRMEEDAAQVLDYETAESDLKDLHLDLRGI